VQILHFSDTHAERETLRRLEHLVEDFGQSDVVAHTGDATSNYGGPPVEWNEWPQAVKLSVPGEHGETHLSYSHLTLIIKLTMIN
jgi:predicted phosphodiesterase